MSEAGYLTIGKVVKELQAQYPELSVSKVRYLEDEGLITPSSRSEGGYRLYSARDVERLKKILYLQKNKFLPLSVIKEQLDGFQAGMGGTSNPLDGMLFVSEEDLHTLHPTEQIPQVLGVSLGFVRRLEETGLIAFKVSPQGRELVDGQDFPLILACDGLRRYGIEPRNLRQYVTAANRESAMFEQALLPFSRGRQGKNEELKTMYDEAFGQMVGLVNIIRAVLIKQRIKND